MNNPHPEANAVSGDPSGEDVFVFSRPFDVHRWSDYPKLGDCLTGLVAELEHREVRKRKRTGSVAKKFRDAVRCLVLDLYCAWADHPELQVGVSLGKGSFSGKSRYGALFLSYDAFKPAFDGLTALGYVTIDKRGYHDRASGKGHLTRIRATQKLIDLLIGAELSLPLIGSRTGPDAEETLILRDGQKQAVEYTDTERTRKMRTNLARINEALGRSWVDLYLTDDELRALNRRMASDFRRGEREVASIDLTKRHLHRVFNNADWEQGGRFYGGWWENVPSDYRRYVMINGKHTVEIDYSGMHAAMMYAAVGQRLDNDPYDIGLPSVPRSLIKLTFNKLINASGRIRAPDDFDVPKLGLTWAELQKRLVERHEPIRQFLGTGYGVKLQNEDASIAEAVMLRFLEMGYIALPVHDSFIVHHALEDELSLIMVQEFAARTGVRTPVKLARETFLKSYRRNAGTAIVIDADIMSLFDANDPYKGYRYREECWFKSLG